MAKKPAGKPAKKDKAKSKAKGGAKGRSMKNAAGATERPPVSTETKMIGEKDWQNLHRRRTSLKKQAKEITGSAGELLVSAAENKSLDKPANAFIEKLWAMSPQKRMTTLACFDHYRTFKHFDTDKTLDEDETGQGQLDIPRQEAGEQEPKAPKNGAAKNGSGGEEPNKVVDLRPPHLRTPAEGGTKVVEDLAKNAGASTSTSASEPSAAKH